MKLFDEETAKLQYEIFEKTIKKKKKEDYIEFLLGLTEQIEDIIDMILNNDDLDDYNE